ncbi:hypothetical protein [Streptomyces sp. NPDC007063]|uniref:hypothetical protein n=2 Tax=unclassified Streptomyces TaxID=2593676 RepID=UPI003679DF26
MGRQEADLCRQDMAKIESAVGNVRTALKAVTDLMGSDTWAGTAADKWAGDFNGRMSSLNYLFNSYPAEEQRLITRAGEEKPK